MLRPQASTAYNQKIIFTGLPGAGENYFNSFLNSYKYIEYKNEYEFVKDQLYCFHGDLDIPDDYGVIVIDAKEAELYTKRLFFIKRTFSRLSHINLHNLHNHVEEFLEDIKRVQGHYERRKENWNIIISNIKSINVINYRDLFVYNKKTGTFLDDFMETHKQYHKKNVELIHKIDSITGLNYARCILVDKRNKLEYNKNKTWRDN